jgi:hypothetical protein
MSKYAISDIKTDLETRDILFELKPTLPHEVHYKVITTKTACVETRDVAPVCTADHRATVSLVTQ